MEIHNQLELKEDKSHLLKENVKFEVNNNESGYPNVGAESVRMFWEDVVDEVDFDFNNFNEGKSEIRTDRVISDHVKKLNTEYTDETILKRMLREDLIDKVDVDLTEATSVAEELYSGHMVKEDIVVGPVGFHKPALLCYDKDVKTSKPKRVLETVAAPLKGWNSTVKSFAPGNRHDDVTCKENRLVTSPLVTMGELATSLPEENLDIFYAIIKIIDQHYPKNWRDWEVYNLSFSELFGNENSAILETKIRFALPTLDLTNAFHLLTTSLSASTYRTIRNTLIKWPLTRALIYTPQWLAMRIHSSSYCDLMNTVKAIKPKLILTRKAQLKHSSINRKRPNPTSDSNIHAKKTKITTEPPLETPSAEEGREQICAMLSTILRQQAEVINKIKEKETEKKRNETVVKIVNNTKKSKLNLNNEKARAGSANSKTEKQAISESTSQEERNKMMQAKVAGTEQKIAKIQRMKLLSDAQERTVPIAEPRLVSAISESTSNIERKKVLRAQITEAERELAKLGKKRDRVTQEPTIAKIDTKLAKAIPDNSVSTSSNPRKEMLQVKMTETEQKIAKSKRIRRREEWQESTKVKADPKIITATADSTSNKREEMVREKNKAAKRKEAELQIRIEQPRRSKERARAKVDPKLDDIPNSTLSNQRMEILRAKIAETDRELAKFQSMKELQVTQEQITKADLKLVNAAAENTSSRIEILLAKMAKAEQAFTNLQKERHRISQEQPIAKSDSKLVNASPESSSRNVRKEMLLEKIEKAEREFTNLRKERIQLTQEHPVAKADPKLVNYGRKVQKLGQREWQDIQLADIRHQLEAAPVFTSLKVNDSLRIINPKRNSADVLESSDQTLAAITHGLIQQQIHFLHMFKNVPRVIKNATCFVEAQTAYTDTTAAMMKYTCGSRAKVLKERRDVYIQNSALKSILRDIPPSDTHLFDDTSLTQAIEEQGGIHKFF